MRILVDNALSPMLARGLQEASQQLVIIAESRNRTVPFT